MYSPRQRKTGASNRAYYQAPSVADYDFRLVARRETFRNRAEARRAMACVQGRLGGASAAPTSPKRVLSATDPGARQRCKTERPRSEPTGATLRARRINQEQSHLLRDHAGSVSMCGSASCLSRSRKACVPAWNVFRRRWMMPSGRTSVQPSMGIATRRPCSMSLRRTRTGMMLMPAPRMHGLLHGLGVVEVHDTMSPGFRSRADSVSPRGPPAARRRKPRSPARARSAGTGFAWPPGDETGRPPPSSSPRARESRRSPRLDSG